MKKHLQCSDTLRRIMRITATQLVLSLFILGGAYAEESTAQGVLGQKLSLKMEGVEVKRVLTQLEKQVDVRFVFSSKIIQSNRRVTVSVRNEPLSTVLDGVLKPLGVDYEASSGNIVILKREKIPVSTIENQSASAFKRSSCPK